jgi:hypothetical protein
MSLISKAWQNVKDVASGDKDLIDRKTFLGKIGQSGINQIHNLTGGKSLRTDQLRRYGNMAAGSAGGAVTGFKTGGPIGAILGATAGGATGYQDKDPVTGRNALQNAGVGAAEGYGIGSGASALGSGGSGWTLGINKPVTAGVNGATSADTASSGNLSGMNLLELGSKFVNPNDNQQEPPKINTDILEKLKADLARRRELTREAYMGYRNV